MTVTGIMEDNEYWIVQSKTFPTMTRNGGDSHRNIPAYNDSGDSIESVASVVVPRRALRLTRNTPFVIEQYRNVDSKDFYLCLCSILLLVSAVGLIGTSMWTLVTRIPYIYLSEHVSYLGIVSFTICAGLLCFPSSWLAWGAHARKSGYIPLLAVFLCVSIIMLATGTALGTIYRSRITFDWIPKNNSYKSLVIKNLTIYEESRPINVFPRLQAGPYRSSLNSSMIAALYSYNNRPTIKYAWDSIHQRFRCCGVNSPYDWYAVRHKIPESCCKKFYVYDSINNQTELYNQCAIKNVYLEGCLDGVAYDLAHHSAILTSVGYIVLFLELITLILCTVLYTRMRVQSARSLRPSVSRLSYSYLLTPTSQSSYAYHQRQSMDTNIITAPQVYYRYIQPPSGIHLQQLPLQQLQQQQLQQQQLQQRPQTPTMSPVINAELNTPIIDNYELMHVPN